MPTINSIGSNIPIEIVKGGTSATSFTNTNGIVYYDGSILNTTSVGTSTHVLTSNGAGVAPTFQAVPSGATNVTAASNLTTQAIVLGDGGSRGVKTGTAVISANGEMTNSSQPAFLAIASTQSNITGDATVAKLNFTTENFDNNADYDGTNTFTAPVNGRYIFIITLDITGITSSHTYSYNSIFTSNLEYFTNLENIYNISSGGTVYLSSSVICYMDAADVAYVNLVVSNGTKVVDFLADSRFSGFLTC